MISLIFFLENEIPSDQALAQLAAIAVTLAIAALGGTVTGSYLDQGHQNLFMWGMVWYSNSVFNHL
jgi:hypothetical protein